MSPPAPPTDPKSSAITPRPAPASSRAPVPEPPPTMSMPRHLRAGLVFFVIMILFAGVAYPLGIATLGWGLHSGPSTTPVASNSTSPPANNSSANSTVTTTGNFAGFRAPSTPAALGSSGGPVGPVTHGAPLPQTYVYLGSLRSSGLPSANPAPALGFVGAGASIAR